MRKVLKVMAIVLGVAVALFCALYGTFFFLLRKDFMEIDPESLDEFPEEMLDEPYGE